MAKLDWKCYHRTKDIPKTNSSNSLFWVRRPRVELEKRVLDNWEWVRGKGEGVEWGIRRKEGDVSTEWGKFGLW